MNKLNGIYILKAICAFLVITIHIGFPGIFGIYFLPFARLGVPLFFMISGFFYKDIIEKHQQLKHINKIITLITLSNFIYILWDCYQNTTISLNHKNIFNLLLFNIFPFPSEYVLWYLGSLLYVLIIALFKGKISNKKICIFFVIVLLLINLSLGTYSKFIFHQAFARKFSRNFLFIGVPYFYIGVIIRDKKDDFINLSNSLKYWIIFLSFIAIIEKFFLLSYGIEQGTKSNGDIYLSTTPLAICIFYYFIINNENYRFLIKIGESYSTWVYILHPIFIVIIKNMFKSNNILNNLYSYYLYVAPIIVFLVTIIFIKLINIIYKFILTKFINVV